MSIFSYFASLLRSNSAAAARYLDSRLSAIETAQSALASFGGPYTCLSGDAVGAVVYFSASGTVAKADADGSGTRPAVGLISSKPTTTSCNVQFTGVVTGLSGLTPGALQYLSGTAGGLTETAPTANAQIVGVAITSTSMFLLPSLAGAGALTVYGAAALLSTLAVTGALTGSSTIRGTALGAGAAALATGINSAGPVVVGTFTVATLPSASTYARGIIWVSDASGGAKPCISDGTNWKIITLGSTVS